MPPTYVIVGNGPAGFEAAKSIRKHDPYGKIIILTSEKYGFYSRPGLAYYLTAKIPESQLFSHSSTQLHQLGIDLIKSRVISINPTIRDLQLKNGICLNYDTLLLATGARAVLPELPGINQTDLLCVCPKRNVEIIA